MNNTAYADTDRAKFLWHRSSHLSSHPQEPCLSEILKKFPIKKIAAGQDKNPKAPIRQSLISYTVLLSALHGFYAVPLPAPHYFIRCITLYTALFHRLYYSTSCKAAKPSSPVRTLTTCSTLYTNIFPSPICPV